MYQNVSEMVRTCYDRNENIYLASVCLGKRWSLTFTSRIPNLWFFNLCVPDSCCIFSFSCQSDQVWEGKLPETSSLNQEVFIFLVWLLEWSTPTVSSQFSMVKSKAPQSLDMLSRVCIRKFLLFQFCLVFLYHILFYLNIFFPLNLALSPPTNLNLESNPANSDITVQWNGPNTPGTHWIPWN